MSLGGNAIEAKPGTYGCHLFAKFVHFGYYCTESLNGKKEAMKSTTEYIALIASHADELKLSFGVRSLRFFGSVSRIEQRNGSDIDVCVDMEPKTYLVVRLKRFLENLLQCSVDVVRMHKHMNPYLLDEINRDGIYVIQ